MRSTHLLAALAVSSLAAVAHGAAEDSPPSKDSSASSAPSCGGGVGASCTSDAACRGDLVCDAICPENPLPGYSHCLIAGSHCEPKCKETSKELSGKSFESVDSAHLLKFDSPSTYTQTTRCPKVPGQNIRCLFIAVQTGTFKVNGAKISLTADSGHHDTLTVEPRCYDGLLDHSNNIELYPAS